MWVPSIQEHSLGCHSNLVKFTISPSTSYLNQLYKELHIPYRKVRDGLEIREIKSDIEHLSDFYSKLETLYREYAFRPCDFFNTDEVGIHVSARTIHLFSGREAIRRNLRGNGHLTALLTTNAAGHVFRPFFVFPGDDMTCVPSGALPEEIYTSYNTSAYMQEEQFQQWMSRFIDEIGVHRKSTDGVRPILVLVDGHSSRLNATTVLTACHHIHLLCLPSHMTHLLQPNDCYFNKIVKDNIQCEITEMVEVRENICLGELAFMTVKSLNYENIPQSILDSFKHTGVSPFDSLKMTTLLAKETVPPFDYEDECVILTTVSLAQEELAKKDNLVAQKRKREEATPKVRTSRFSTKKARVLTSAENQTALRYAKELSNLENLTSQTRKRKRQMENKERNDLNDSNPL